MTAAGRPILELDNVSASYSSYRALFGVSFSVPENGIVALVGSNGAGKSTVARVVSGLVPATGRILVGGQDVTRRSAHRIAALGVVHVPEGRAIFSSLTVEENLTVSFRKRVGHKGVSDALQRAYDAFPVLAERRKQLGGTLSGGQQRILSLAKVLAISPRLLIADELSLGLAPVVVDQVYDGLTAINRQGAALLVVEQQVDRVLAIAQRAVLLMKGAVAWEGPAHEARQALEARVLAGASANGASAATPLRAAAAPSSLVSPPAPAPAPPVTGVTPPAPPPPAPPAPGATGASGAPAPRRPWRTARSKAPAADSWNGAHGARPAEPPAGPRDGNGEAPPGLWVTGPWS